MKKTIFDLNMNLRQDEPIVTELESFLRRWYGCGLADVEGFATPSDFACTHPVDSKGQTLLALGICSTREDGSAFALVAKFLDFGVEGELEIHLAPERVRNCEHLRLWYRLEKAAGFEIDVDLLLSWDGRQVHEGVVLTRNSLDDSAPAIPPLPPLEGEEPDTSNHIPQCGIYAGGECFCGADRIQEPVDLPGNPVVFTRESIDPSLTMERVLALEGRELSAMVALIVLGREVEAREIVEESGTSYLWTKMLVDDMWMRLPDYHKSLDLMVEPELRVIEEFGVSLLERSLKTVIGAEEASTILFHNSPTDRARACIIATLFNSWEEKGACGVNR